ncbi:osmotically-inducible protein OsmY [Kushneria sinocarnis]|uniref:Osmotically-inducible protein OsmY n=1 Tax=Kushneria sinocarnis TaxID=595502 RepID=A0A420WVC1_9GAMM|nr:BON domain-containing protein [Kushneria sinocarnis]RKR02508.1 osmotically-inducible protein OsmY [Kushneria sinocarnis]
MLQRLLLTCLIALIPLAGCSTITGEHGYGFRPDYVVEQDQRIARTLWQRINDNQSLATGHINVDVYNTRVLLTGQVPDAASKQQAARLARDVEAVHDVRNELSVAANTSTGQRLHDTWLTSKIRTRMAASENIDADRIRVTTENGVVYLMGLVRHDEAETAIGIVRDVDGVQRIVKVFEYI